MKFLITSFLLLFSLFVVGQASQVMDFNSGGGSSNPSNFVNYNGEMYFTIYPNGIPGESELWKYDGVNSPVMIPDSNTNPILSPVPLISFNGSLFLTYMNINNGRRKGLWEYDGISMNLLLSPQSSLSVNDIGEDFIIFNQKLYFGVNDSLTGNELWEYDGTNAPTMVFDLDTVSSAGSNPFSFRVFQNNLYFVATTDLGATNKILFKYDGVNSPTVIAEHISGFSRKILEMNGKLYYSKETVPNNFWSSTIYEYDGVNSPAIYTNNLGSGHVYHSQTLYSNHFGKIYFLVIDSLTGQGTPWEVDNMGVASALNGPNLSSAVPYNNEVYYAAWDSIHGTELWKFDSLNAVRLTNVHPTGNGVFGPPVLFSNKLYFQGEDGVTGKELWVFDPAQANSINKIPTSEYSIYPNPLNGILTVETNHFIEHLDIYNSTGMKVRSYVGNNKIYDLLNLSSGIYFVSIKTSKGFIIEKVTKM